MLLLVVALLYNGIVQQIHLLLRQLRRPTLSTLLQVILNGTKCLMQLNGIPDRVHVITDFSYQNLCIERNRYVGHRSRCSCKLVLVLAHSAIWDYIVRLGLHHNSTTTHEKRCAPIVRSSSSSIPPNLDVCLFFALHLKAIDAITCYCWGGIDAAVTED